jgi:CBS domain-containing protein
MSVGRICTRTVATASPRETVEGVAQRMVVHNVGTVVIVSETNHPVGIVTDRDITIRCVAAGKDPAGTPVSAVMSEEPRTVHEDVPIEQALQTMVGAETRRLIVIGQEGRLAGLLSLDDVLELLSEEVEAVGRLIRKDAPRMTVV